MPRTRQPNQPPQHLALETEGQRLLRAVPGGHAAIGAAAGVSAMTVSRWRAGHLRPADEYRATLARLYMIPIPSWNRNSNRADAALQSHRAATEPTTHRVAPASPASPARLPTAPCDTDEGVAGSADDDALTMTEALAFDIDHADALEGSGRADIAAKLRANCLVDYIECKDTDPELYALLSIA
ncbi:MAG: hypothetical protein WDO74_37445 [Pseudomonadota bacterium]